MRRSLLAQSFLGILSVALLSVAGAGLTIRWELQGAFSTYLQGLPSPMGPGMGTGRRMMLGAAERTFLASVDKGLLIGSLVAVALAILTALAAAYYLTRPIERLTGAARVLASGDLSHRVQPGGPAEVRALGESFNDMADSLATSESLRRRLVADVAHELRNPISSLRAQAEGIADGVLPASSDRLASLADDTRILSRLVGDLQELSAADAGGLRYDMRPTDLCAIAHAEATRAAPRARTGVRVLSRCEAVSVMGDEGRLGQVVRNLLDNALRHTTAGEITVSCRLEGEAVALEVADTGEGIPEADLPYVFERFYRADASRAADTGGSGIGLAISRRIIEDHGGSVFARDRPGGGAVVGFRIPSATG